MGLLAVLMVVVLVLAVLVVVPRRGGAVKDRNGRRESRVDDAEELARAESDLAGLDAMATPDESAEELPDWGPGAPKVNRNSS